VFLNLNVNLQGQRVKNAIVLCYHISNIATAFTDPILREEIEVDESIILKRAFKNMKAWSGLIWFRRGRSGWLLWKQFWTYCFP
jgi:hypothetical protein